MKSSITAIANKDERTLMVRVPREAIDAVVGRQFSDMHAQLLVHFKEMADRLIWEAVHSDWVDVDTVTKARPALFVATPRGPLSSAAR